MRKTVEKAVELAPEHPDSLIAETMFALISDWDLPRALEISARAVELVEPLGAETLVHARLAGNGGAQVTVRVQGYPTVSAGDQVGLTFAREHLQGFPRA